MTGHDSENTGDSAGSVPLSHPLTHPDIPMKSPHNGMWIMKISIS